MSHREPLRDRLPVHDFYLNDDVLCRVPRRLIFLAGFDVGNVWANMQHGLPFQLSVRVLALETIASIVRDAKRTMLVTSTYTMEATEIEIAEISIEGAA